MLETTYIFSLRQLLKIAFELKRCLWQKLKPKKFLNVSKATIEKQVGSWVQKVKTSHVAIDNHMTIEASINWEEYNRGCVGRWRFWN